MQSFNKGFLEVAAALAILLIGLVLGRFIGKFSLQAMKQLELNKHLQKTKIPAEEIISSLLKYLFYITSAILALHQLGLATKVLYSIFLVLIVLLLVFIILAIKDFIPNIISGTLLLRRKNLKKGDYIRVGNMEGKILDISLAEVKLKTKEDDILLIPTSVFQKRITKKYP